MRAVLSFLAATVVAVLLSAGSERYLGLSEAVSYVVFGAALVVAYEVIKRVALRIR